MLTFIHLARPARKLKDQAVSSVITSPERSGRSKTRVGVSQSQRKLLRLLRL